MAGHSKWANIQHKKAATDKKRAKVFTRVLKEITVAARMGGGDPDGNPRLRNAIQEGKANNVPSDNMERAIKKGTGELEGADYEEITYEGYGPGGLAVLVEVMTDNRNRTVGEVRHVFSRYGGNLGENGCVAWMFDRRGLFILDPEGMDEDRLMEVALEVEAEDYSAEDDSFQIFTAADAFHTVGEALDALDGVKVATRQIAMIPQNTVDLDEEKAKQALKFMDAIEDQDDVQNVWANLEVSDEVLAALV
ncbi:MAG: YebC/PmpR family DNA-binding transcriptional regulator [Acidobacteriota bacterium]